MVVEHKQVGQMAKNDSRVIGIDLPNRVIHLARIGSATRLITMRQWWEEAGREKAEREGIVLPDAPAEDDGGVDGG